MDKLWYGWERIWGLWQHLNSDKATVLESLCSCHVKVKLINKKCSSSTRNSYRPQSYKLPKSDSIFKWSFQYKSISNLTIWKTVKFVMTKTLNVAIQKTFCRNFDILKRIKYKMLHLSTLINNVYNGTFGTPF